MSDNKLQAAGDINIEYVTIVTTTEYEFNITPQVFKIEIYEDIFSNFISGKIVIEDTQELGNLLPLVGEEFIRIKLKTPVLEEKHCYDGEFYIYKIDDRVRIKERSLGYCVYFISKEAIYDLNTKLVKAYSGKISNIVSDILTDNESLSTTKDINIEETSNSTKYVSNFWSPTKNIQYLLEHAVNENDSPSYLFFENKYGLNFLSLDTIYKECPVIQSFIWDNYNADIQGAGNVVGTSKRDVDEDYRRILELQIENVYNYMDRIQSGMYGSEIIYYDLLSKTYVHNAYAYDFDDNNHLNEFPVYTDRIAFRSKSLLFHGRQYYNNFNGYGIVSNTKQIQKRNALLNQAEGYKINITVWGRTDYSAGQVVDVSIPKHTQLKSSETEINDEYLSGKYLVSAICHSIDRKKHECTMELIKDSFITGIK